MKNMKLTDHRSGSLRRVGALLVAAIALGLAWAAPPASAAEPSLGDESQACQKCHDKPDITMKTQDGKTWPLTVSTDAYLKSRHGTTDCADCHEDIGDDKHATEKPAVKSRRDYALKLNDGCISCHKKHVTQFQDSVHAAMLKEGSDKAPLCSDCHAVHTLLNVKFHKPVAETPCLKCHEDIGKAYVKDVHGLERVAKGKPAPICADCHQAHAIKAASFGTALKDNCLACHKEAVAQHKDWLPNTGRHFEAIACVVCHAPNAERRVNLRLFSQKGQKQLIEQAGVPRFEQLVKAADQQDQGLDERALWSLLQEFNRGSGLGDVVLRGRLEVASGVQAHQLAEKSKAISDCDTCHRRDAQAFQSVVVSIAGPDGRTLRHGVDKDVLRSAVATASVRGFYAIGANRIQLLDWLLVAAVLGSIGGVLAHMTVKWATRRIRAKVAAEQHGGPTH
ncbi:MAG: hypothetical protein HY855_00105 [Burkholderiales bacterium]|nr:hypothetical protein [Burkholderiales bacterium]